MADGEMLTFALFAKLFSVSVCSQCVQSVCADTCYVMAVCVDSALVMSANERLAFAIRKIPVCKTARKFADRQ